MADTPTIWLEVAVASVMPLTILAVIVSRFLVKSAGGKGGLGVRTIQFVAVAMTIPAITLLALHGRLQGEAVATIFGALAGFLLSNIAKFDEADRG